jgi:8-oxo-dGTP diphosphatase
MTEPTTPPQAEPITWKTPAATADISVFTVIDDALNVLLIRRENAPHAGQWALPGGFIDVDKDGNLQQAAERTLKEKTDVSAFLEQVGTYGGNARDERGWLLTVLYFALVKSDETEPSSGRNTTETQWFPLQQALQLKLAFDHNQLLSDAHSRLTDKVEYTALPVRLMPATFTLSELQKVYEVLMNRELQKKSFRRRMEGTNILEDTGELQRAGARPAKLYRVSDSFVGHHFSRTLEGKREG